MTDERADRGAGQRAAGRRTSDLGVAGPATAPIDSPSSRSFPPTPRCLERNCAYRDPRFLPLGARAPAEGSPRRFPQWTGCTKSVTNLGLPRRIQPAKCQRAWGCLRGASRWLGLLAGLEARIESLGVFGRLIRRSQTVGEALREVVSDHPMFSSSGRVWLPSRDEQVEFCHTFTNKFDKFDEGWQQLDHYVLMLMLGIVRLGSDPTWSPAQVHVQTGESAVFRDAEPLVAARLAFGQPATTITLPATLLRQRLPPPSADVQMPGDSVDTWTASAPARDFVTSV